MSDSRALLRAADRLADRFRSMPQGRLAELAPEGLLLARRLADRAQRLEGGSAHGELPEAGIFAVGDQIALAAHDLAAALPGGADGTGSDGAGSDSAGSGDAGSGSAGPDGAGAEAAGMLADSLAELAAAYRLATTRSARM